MSTIPPMHSYSGPDRDASSTEPPLALPWYGSPFLAGAWRAVRKYATFSGRASRSEFWWFTLATAVIAVVFSIVEAALGHSSDIVGGVTSAGGAVVALDNLINLALIVPTLAVTWRRLHDVGRSGAWAFLSLVPIVGGIIVIVWLASQSQPGGRRFDRV